MPARHPGETSGNRPPTPDEIATCLPYLNTQIDLIRPKAIVALGATSVAGLFGGKQEGITKLRGKWMTFRGISVMPTLHPSYLLRPNGAAAKPLVWQDMLAVMDRLAFPSRKNSAVSSAMEPWVDELEVAGRTLPILWRRTRSARRYVLRVRSPGILAITLPCFGSKKEAIAFAVRQRSWIEAQLAKLAAAPAVLDWGEGMEIWFRGERVRLALHQEGGVRRVVAGGMSAVVGAGPHPVREAVQGLLKETAFRELPARLHELAAEHGFNPSRVVIRNQRSRWGSCSIRKTISLNWRLVMAPVHVRDYILLHELCHLRVMSHSARYWAEVEKVCPSWREAEKWIKRHARELW